MAFWDDWFDDEEEIHISVTTVKLAPEGQQLVRDSLLNSIIGGRGIASDLIQNLQGSLAYKAKNLQRYAKDHFTYGLPNGSGEKVQQASDVVAQAIQQDIGERVFIEGSEMARAAPAFFIEEYLIANRGWDSATKIVSIPPAGHPFTRDVTVVRRQFTPTGDLLITYREKGTQGEDLTILPLFTETVPYSGVDPEKEYYHTTYQKYVGTALQPEIYFWHYEVGSGVYPTLDNVHFYSEPVPYLPIIPLRINKQNMVAANRENTELYKTSHRCLQIMDMNFKEIGDNVHKNPDVGDVNGAYLLFAINPVDDHQAVKHYMHEWIKHMNATYPSSAISSRYEESQAALAWSLGGRYILPSRVRVNYRDAGLQNYFEFLFTEVRVEAGVISNQIGYTELRKVNGTTNYGYDNTGIECKQQISPTEIEITYVAGLKHATYVFDGEWYHSNVGDANFTLPINMNALARLPLPVASDAISHSIRITFTTYQITSTPWYASGVLSIIILVVVVAIAVFTGQLQIAVAAIAAMTAAQIAVYIAVSIAVSIVIKAGLKELSKYVSPEIAMIIAAVTYAVMFVFKPDPTSVMSAAVVSAAASAPSDFVAMVQDREMQELLSEAVDFSEEMEEKLEELEELEDELEFLDGNFDLTEALLERRHSTPRIEDFERLRRRVIELPENNVMVLRTIEEFVNIKLKLPSFEETINSFNQDGVTLKV